MENNYKKEKSFSRRDFLKTTGALTGGIIGGSMLGGLVGSQWVTNDGDGQEESLDTEDSDAVAENQQIDIETRVFFKRNSDFNVLSAAVERIYPEDENGPGAVALGVPYFIDKQLSGSWGNNAIEYMMGPFTQGESTQGIQSALNRGDIFLNGIRRINEISQDENNDDFYNLDESQQNVILTSFEEDEIELRGFNSSTFFNMLVQATIEGAYSDPVYGGNRNMDGWRMKEYPGPVMTYRDVIGEEEFLTWEPISLSDHSH